MACKFRFRSFISIYSFTAGIKNCPTGSAPVPAAGLPEPATAMSRGAARPVLAACACSGQLRWPSFKLAVAAAASADTCFAAAVSGAARQPLPCPARSPASPLWTSSSQRPSQAQQEAHAAAASALALQVSKFYIEETAESTSNDVQCRDKEIELVPLH